MDILNISGGGAAGLNFKVVGSPVQPATAAPNTIWVNTSVKITGYVFDVNQPTGSEGLVWIQTGTSSVIPFNALKKNTLKVYPTKVRQYIGGEWVNKAADMYYNGEWINFSAETPDNLIIFDGTLNTEITGSWSGDVKSPDVSSNRLLFYAGGNQSATTNTSTHSKYIDVTDYNTLTLHADSAYYTLNVYVRLVNESGSTLAEVNYNNQGTGTRTIDTSNISGNIKLKVLINANSISDYIAFSRIVFSV